MLRLGLNRTERKQSSAIVELHLQRPWRTMSTGFQNLSRTVDGWQRGLTQGYITTGSTHGYEELEWKSLA